MFKSFKISETQLESLNLYARLDVPPAFRSLGHIFEPLDNNVGIYRIVFTVDGIDKREKSTRVPHRNLSARGDSYL